MAEEITGKLSVEVLFQYGERKWALEASTLKKLLPLPRKLVPEDRSSPQFGLNFSFTKEMLGEPGFEDVLRGQMEQATQAILDKINELGWKEGLFK